MSYGLTTREKVAFFRHTEYKIPAWVYGILFFAIVAIMFGNVVDTLGLTTVHVAQAAEPLHTNAYYCHQVLKNHEPVVGATLQQVTSYCKSIGI